MRADRDRRSSLAAWLAAGPQRLRSPPRSRPLPPPTPTRMREWTMAATHTAPSEGTTDYLTLNVTISDDGHSARCRCSFRQGGRSS